MSERAKLLQLVAVRNLWTSVRLGARVSPMVNPPDVIRLQVPLKYVHKAHE